MGNIVRIAGMGMNDYWKSFGYFTGVIETWYSSFLAASEAYPGMGWRMCEELIAGCAQPYGWKITCQTQCGTVFEWRWFQRRPHKVTMTSEFWFLIGVGLSDSH